MSRTATIIGASGLIGSQLLDQLLTDNYYDHIKIIVRRPLEGISDPRLETIVINFEDEKAFENAIAGSEVVFSAVGTTNKNVRGDKNAYRKIDYDIAVNAAKAAAKYGVYTFALVSSVGADAANNNNFYIKLKGVIEEAVSKEQIPQVIIMRPSLLMGNRKESRPMEKVFQAVMPVFSPLMFGSLKKYKPIEAEDIAKAMIAATKQGIRGVHIYEYSDIMKLLPQS